ncbi:universal stress protein [Candidatus Binatia bacterium]|nr:universal stress protein [Candidatus Binatia bacterium]
MMTDAKKIQTIVVATDFSEDARAALDWALDVARDHGARIVLTHAAALAASAAPDVVPVDDRWYRALEESARDELEAWARSVRSRNVAVETLLTYEPAAASIVEVAERHHADLLVVGTRGSTGLTRLFLGSVASRIVRRAKCPVVTTHSPSARHWPVRTLLVPTDLSAASACAAAAAADLMAHGADRRVVVLHAYRLPIGFSAKPALTLRREMEEYVAETRAKLDVFAERFRKIGVAVEIVVEEGVPWQRISHHAERRNVDLIAMGTHGRSGVDRLLLGSTVERVLPVASCPLLTRAPDDV